MGSFKILVMNIECEYMQHLCFVLLFSWLGAGGRIVYLFEWIVHPFHLLYFWWLLQLLKSQVTENKGFIERKREVVSFSPNDKASVDSFLQVGFAQSMQCSSFVVKIASHPLFHISTSWVCWKHIIVECRRRKSAETLHSLDFMHQ
jgi:hypothetical protein